MADILPWVKDAGDPYYDWFFPDHTTCMKCLRLWLANPSSEIFIGRTYGLFVNGRVAGGFIALSGRELGECRSADTRLLITKTNRKLRREIVARLAQSAGLFPPVGDDEYYLSKIGVSCDCRGRGYGSLLMEAYLDRGIKRGLPKYRLDVSVGNETAIRCYEKYGFTVICRTAAENRELEYLSMTYRV